MREYTFTELDIDDITLYLTVNRDGEIELPSNYVELITQRVMASIPKVIKKIEHDVMDLNFDGYAEKWAEEQKHDFAAGQAEED